MPVSLPASFIPCRRGIARWLLRSRLADAALAEHADFVAKVRAELSAGATPADAIDAASNAMQVRAAVTPRGIHPPLSLVTWLHECAGDTGFSRPNALLANPFEILAARSSDVMLARAMRMCAVAWRAHERRGFALEPLLAVAEQLLRQEIEMRSQAREETAGVRASTVMLMLLPAVTPVFGAALGCDPWGWLFGTWLGWVDTAAAALLFAANSACTSYLIKRALA